MPGVGALFYGAKRLFALDLEEFLAYREQRRIEYLEAKEIANELEEKSTPEIDAQLNQPTGQRPSRWHPTRGVLRDESG